MKLRSSNGQAFDLSLVGYQFPTGPTEWHDRNWLNVRIDVVHPRGRWHSSEPSLLTSEVLELADWLELIAAGALSVDDRPFIEPNLRFEVGNRALRIYFELESRPNWARADGAGLNDLWIELPLNELDLRAAASDLRQQLERFPLRAGE